MNFVTTNDTKIERTPTSQIPLLLGTVLIVYVGQMTLNPIIGPLSRELAMPEWQLGVTISAAACMVVATSGFWGRRAQSRGFKLVLMMALALAVVTMILFSGLAALGMQGILTGTLLFLLFVLLRGVGFGTAIAAVPPTAQAYIAEFTPEGPARVKGMAGVGAVQGLASILGAIVGALLVGFGLLAPIIVVPALIAIALVIVGIFLRPGASTQLVENPIRVSPFDRRIMPFLVAGFGVFTALGFIQNTVSFIIMDRFQLDKIEGGRLSGIVMLVLGIGTVIAQAVIVPVSKWAPPMLLRAGTIVGTLGFAAMLPNADLWVMFVASLLIGLGIGIAMPGYTSGPTMLVKRDEQGGLAGLIGATNGLTYVLAPTLSTVFYGWWQPLPIVVSVAVLGIVAVFVLVHPAFHKFQSSVEATAAAEADADADAEEF